MNHTIYIIVLLVLLVGCSNEVPSCRPVPCTPSTPTMCQPVVEEIEVPIYTNITVHNCTNTTEIIYDCNSSYTKGLIKQLKFYEAREDKYTNYTYSECLDELNSCRENQHTNCTTVQSCG